MGHGDRPQRARRRPHRRRRHLRHRRGATTCRPSCPDKTLRDPRGARRDRRHLGPVPLPGHPLGLGHVHARLPVPAVDERQGDRRRPGDPAPTSARPRASTASTATSASATGSWRAEWSTDDARWTVEVERSAPASRSHDRRLPVLCRRLLRLRRAATRPQFPGRERFRGPIVHPQQLARGPRLRGQARRGHRQRRDRGDARARAGRAGRARDDAAALAELHRLACPRDGRARQLRCARLLGRAPRYALARLEEHRAADRLSTSSAAGARSCARALIRAASTPGSCPRATTSTRTSTRATTRGTSACASCPTATCSRRSGRARVGGHRHDRDVHRARHPARVRRRARRPTSSSPRPG